MNGITARQFGLLICFVIGSLFGGQQIHAATLKPVYQPETTLGLTPDQQLDECLKLAKSGDVKGAVRKAQLIHFNNQSSRLIAVSYLNTLVSIVDQNPTKEDARILNEAIRVVNEVRPTNRYDGKSDPEGSYYFMKALGRLYAACGAQNVKVASKIGILEGQIAQNLKENPSFPKNAMEALGGPLVEMAQSYAVRGEGEKARSSLYLAIDCGFGDFEKLSQDKLFSAMCGETDKEEFLRQLKTRYKKAVDDWARIVVAQFPSSQFNFDVNDIQGGRVSNSDYSGKVLVIDLWATWCPPCRKGIPHYIELQHRYRASGVEVLGISMDNPEDPQSSLQAVRDFASKNKFNYRCGMGDQSIRNMIQGELALPTTLFIDRNNRVRYIARGYHDYAKVEAITKILANENQLIQTGTFYGN